VGTGVTVNTVLPGPTWSEGVERFVEQLAEANGLSVEEQERDFFKSARPSSLIQRFASTEEVADMIAYVASQRASATNGAALRVEGGIVRAAL
jgi:NAD(P)-dependent dehydrogenase (short-subunit alcohol dehydrogenase family)